LNDFASVPPLLVDKTPCFIIYRTDDKRAQTNTYAWYLLSFIPDEAIVKKKMLYSSTRNNLVSALGDSNFVDLIHGTQKAEFSTQGFKHYLESKNSEVPLSEAEKARKEEREQEVNTIVEITQISQASSGVGQSNVVFPLDDTVPEAFRCFSSGEYNYVRLSIDSKKERIFLDDACSIDVEELQHKVPHADCSFHFFRWRHDHDGKTIDSIIFVFATPDGTGGHKPAPVKSRMIYASSKQHVLNSSGLNIDCKLEVGNGSELTVAEFQSTLHPAVAEEKASFKKPTGPKKRTGAK